MNLFQDHKNVSALDTVPLQLITILIEENRVLMNAKEYFPKLNLTGSVSKQIPYLMTKYNKELTSA